jgi:hypothetical protein
MAPLDQVLDICIKVFSWCIAGAVPTRKMRKVWDETPSPDMDDPQGKPVYVGILVKRALLRPPVRPTGVPESQKCLRTACSFLELYAPLLLIFEDFVIVHLHLNWAGIKWRVYVGLRRTMTTRPPPRNRAAS